MSNVSSEWFTRRSTVFSLAILCTLLWGSSYPAIKTGYRLLEIPSDDVPSMMVFAGMRFLLAGIFLLVLMRLIGRPNIAMSWKNVRQLTILGITQTSLQYVFFYIGIAFATGVKASIMNATGTFFSVILAHCIYQNDKLNQRKILGCIVGFAGVFIVNFSDSLLTIDFALKGEGAIVMAAFILAAGSIYGKKVSQHMDAMQMTAWQLSIGGVALLVAGFAFGGQPGHFDTSSVLLLMYLALLSSIAFALWSLLLKYNPVGMITIFNFLIPVFGTMLSALFLGETILEWKYLIALILVCSGIYLVTRVKVRY
ncbi:DMT family transporter [Marinomonas transparens]|uniref:DMT family transporter n=1 Tax=Marinomonas transparens TaxID=2795388 RepID=A0A934JW34_9GAMM|nr:DMT family transporter [Marinomonas transparens]MBJ7539327.1 DMT family transporter [Marinomonas transparens]